MHFAFKPLLPVLWLLLLRSSWIQGQKDEDSNEFLENSSELLDEENNFLAAPCPKKCACSPEGIVDCGGLSLKEFPIDIPETTNHLSLQNNQIEEIFPEELARLYSLETLNLQNNRLTSKGLPEEVFDQLENLNYLYLANNQQFSMSHIWQ